MTTEFDSTAYWERRYRAGGTSGDGSYGDFAAFKGEVVNSVIDRLQAKSVVEWGCGDGNQLQYIHAPLYLGIDTSATALDMCRTAYVADPRKRFVHPCDYHGERFDLALSLDVIFHLTRYTDFVDYMYNLFGSAPYVLIYSSNTDVQQPGQSPHMRHHNHGWFVAHAFSNAAEIWACPNRYPKRSVSDFVLYGPRSQREGGWGMGKGET